MACSLADPQSYTQALTEEDVGATEPSSLLEPTENDVVCGRGLGKNHPGNVMYRHLIQLNKTLYTTCLPGEKVKISTSIVTAITEQGGRFLERKKNNDGTTCWFGIGFQKAVSKTSQALREGQPQRRQIIKEMEVQPNNTSAVANTHHRGDGEVQGLEGDYDHSKQQPEHDPLFAAATAAMEPKEISWQPPSAGPGQQRQQYQQETDSHLKQWDQLEKALDAPPLRGLLGSNDLTFSAAQTYASHGNNGHGQDEQPLLARGNRPRPNLNSSPSEYSGLMTATPLSQLSLLSGFSSRTGATLLSSGITSMGTISVPFSESLAAMSVMDDTPDDGSVWGPPSRITDDQDDQEHDEQLNKMTTTRSSTPLPFLDRCHLVQKLRNRQRPSGITVYAVAGNDGMSCDSSISSHISTASSRTLYRGCGHPPTLSTTNVGADTSAEDAEKISSKVWKNRQPNTRQGDSVSYQNDTFLAQACPDDEDAMAQRGTRHAIMSGMSASDNIFVDAIFSDLDRLIEHEGPVGSLVDL